MSIVFSWIDIKPSAAVVLCEAVPVYSAVVTLSVSRNVTLLEKPFLESPGNLSGPQWHFHLKTGRRVHLKFLV